MVDNIGNFLAPSMAKDHPNLPVVKAEGCYYYGADGKKYLDFTSGIAVENVGHRHPKVVQAIKDSADHLIHGPSGVIIYESILKLAAELQTILPPKLDNFFFANSGTEAIEGALKLAKYTTRSPYVVSFTGCFHGRSMGALSVTTSKSKYRKHLQPSWLAYQLPYALPEYLPEGADPDVFFPEKLEQDVKKLFNHQVDPEEVACMIIEPVLGEGGYIIPPKAWLKKFVKFVTAMAFFLFSMKFKQDLVVQVIGSLHRHSMSNLISWRLLKVLLQDFHLARLLPRKN